MRGKEQTPLTAEQQSSPELLGEENVGLQARLLSGDFTNPRLHITAKGLDPIQQLGVEGIDRPLIKRYQKASLAQRRSYQDETGITYERWKTGFDSYLKKIRDDMEHPERNEFLETIGIDERMTADDFYKDYLKGKSDIVKFVYDVETQATQEQIKQHEDIIRGIGNTFGYASSEVIDHLIHGVRNVKTDIDSFVRKAEEKVNTEDVLHHPLLQTILRDSKEKVEAAQPEEQVEEKSLEEKKEEGKPEEEQPEEKLEKKAPEGIVEPSPHLPEAPQKYTPAERIILEEGEPFIQDHVPKKEEEAQLFPAPQVEIHRDDTPLRKEELDLAVNYLLFNDVDPKDKTEQIERIKVSEAVKYYTRELGTMMQEYGRNFVLDRAGDAVQQIQDALKQIGIKGTASSKSHSWFLWHAAKSRFLANNPDIQELLPNAEYYDSFDPLLHYRGDVHPVDSRRSRQSETAILWSMLGFEVYLHRKKRKDVLFALDPAMPGPEKQLLNNLLDEEPKDEELETLSAYKLREIGRIVRQYRRHQ